MTDDPGVGPDLVRWGRAIRLETVGRTTGRTASTFVSFHEEADGSLLVAARLADAAWARNLSVDPSAVVTLREARFPVVAEPLEGSDFATVIRELILKGGTPAEQLGHGPAFRLRRIVREA